MTSKCIRVAVVSVVAQIGLAVVTHAQAVEGLLAKASMQEVDIDTLLAAAGGVSVAELAGAIGALEADSVYREDGVVASRVALAASAVFLGSSQPEQTSQDGLDIAVWVASHGSSESALQISEYSAKIVNTHNEWVVVLTTLLDRDDLLIVANTLLDVSAESTAHLVITEEWLSGFLDEQAGTHVDIWQGAESVESEFAFAFPSTDSDEYDPLAIESVARSGGAAASMALAIHSGDLLIHLQDVLQSNWSSKIHLLTGMKHCVSKTGWCTNVAANNALWSPQELDVLTQIVSDPDIGSDLGKVSAPAIVWALCRHAGTAALSRAIVDGIINNQDTPTEILQLVDDGYPC
ncbi:MAG: hypothetical protein Phyf2KO_11100 [Phycisphaerales bacterium]